MQIHPPGPRSFIPFGNVLDFRRDMLGFITRMAGYGDVSLFKVGQIPLYLVNHPDIIREVLVTQAKNFHKSLAFDRLKPLLGNGLLTSEDDFHLRQRRLAAPAFHRQRLEHYAETMVEYADRAQRGWQDGMPVDMSAEMMRLTLAVAGKTLFNADVEADAPEVGKALTDVMRVFMRINSPFGFLLDRLPLPSNRRAVEARLALDGIVYRLIDERRKSGEDKGDLLSMLLAARDEEGDRSGMTDLQVRDEVMTIFLAGHETTAVALTWAWYLLAEHPKEARRLHEELDRALGGRLPSVADLPQLVFTRMVFAETLRLYPPAYMTGRNALVDFQAGGYTIPAGNVVLISPYVTQRDRRWWDDPECFNPQRWAAGEEEKRPRFAYFPFGGGPRVCIGEQFAWMEGTLVLAALAQRWQPTLVEGYTPVPEPLITLRVKNGMQMTLRKRS
jgi:cytochrome P450